VATEVLRVSFWHLAHQNERLLTSASDFWRQPEYAQRRITKKWPPRKGRNRLGSAFAPGFLFGLVTTLAVTLASPEAYQAKAGLHFSFGALAVASQFMPAFSHAD
jgi:hypothetical protein